MSTEDRKYTLTLDIFGTQGAWHVLMNSEVKGRSDSRNHNRAVKALKAGCMKEKENKDFDFVGGTMVVTEDSYKFFKELARKKLDAGIQSALGEAYFQLFEAFDVAENELEAVKKEVKA
jgi:hypothetical protein